MPAAAAADPATPPSAIPPSEALLGRTARPLQQRAVGKRSKKAPPLCLPLLALMAGISCWSFGRWLSSSPAPLTTPSTDKRACARWRQKPNHLVLAAGPTGSLEAARFQGCRAAKASCSCSHRHYSRRRFPPRPGNRRSGSTRRCGLGRRCIEARSFTALWRRTVGRCGCALSRRRREQRRRVCLQRNGRVQGLLHHEVILQYIGSITLFSTVPSAAAAAAAAAAHHNGPRVRNSTRTHQSRRLR